MVGRLLGKLKKSEKLNNLFTKNSIHSSPYSHPEKEKAL